MCTWASAGARQQDTGKTDHLRERRQENAEQQQEAWSDVQGGDAGRMIGIDHIPYQTDRE